MITAMSSISSIVNLQDNLLGSASVNDPSSEASVAVSTTGQIADGYQGTIFIQYSYSVTSPYAFKATYLTSTDPDNTVWTDWESGIDITAFVSVTGDLSASEITISSDAGLSTEDIVLIVSGSIEAGYGIALDIGVQNSGMVAENAVTNAEVGITAQATDSDLGDTISYSIVTDEAGGTEDLSGPFKIDSITGVVTVRDGALLDFESAPEMPIWVKATSSDSSFSVNRFTVQLTNVNEIAKGFGVSISGFPATGPEEGMELTATATVESDEDGLPNPPTFSWQWQSSRDGVIWSAIYGATASTFTPDDPEVGSYLRAVALFTDLGGFINGSVSTGTASVKGTINDDPIGEARVVLPVIPTIGSEFQVNSNTVGFHENASVAALSDGGFVVTWTSDSENESAKNILGQRYDALGAPQDEEFQINTRTTNYHDQSSVVGLADGGFVVIWAAFDPNQKISVYSRRYDAEGVAQGAEFKVNTTTTSFNWFPSVAALADGGFVVTWGADDNIYGQRYDAQGVAQGDEFSVGTNPVSRKDFASIAALADGGFVVTWTSQDFSNSYTNIVGQRYDSQGLAQGAEFQVNTYSTEFADRSAVTGLLEGGFVVIWDSERLDGSANNVFGQRYDAAGAAQGDEFQVNTTTFANQFLSAVAPLRDGGFMVTWTSYDQGSRGYDIYGQRYDANGIPLVYEFKANTSADGSQSWPSVVALADGGFVVIWQSNDQNERGELIQGQRYAASFHSEDTTLYVDARQVSDADGLGQISWQWQRSQDNGASWTDIQGATASEYSPGDPDVGFLLRIVGMYTDGQGFANTIYSPPTTPIFNVNDTPVGDAQVLRSPDNILSVDISSITDDDGLGDFTYQWLAEGQAIIGANEATYDLSAQDAGKLIAVAVSYVDGYGTMETLISDSVSGTALNTPPSGKIEIWGNFELGAVITPDVSALQDANGLGSFGYLWLDDAGELISENLTLTITESILGKNLRFKVVYTDRDRFDESVLSDLITIPSDGDDILNLEIGGNTINGYDGLDRVVYADDYESVTVTKTSTAWEINSEAGTDTLEGIERLEFGDKKLALDIDGNAGAVAKLLGAFLGAEGVQITEYVTIGLEALDSGTSFEGLLQLALDTVFGSDPSGTELVGTFYQNLTGQTAPQDIIDTYANLIDSGSLTPLELATEVAEHPLNAESIDLIGLATTGIEYA